jgi:hypothetical protein
MVASSARWLGPAASCDRQWHRKAVHGWQLSKVEAAADDSSLTGEEEAAQFR